MGKLEQILLSDQIISITISPIARLFMPIEVKVAFKNGGEYVGWGFSADNVLDKVLERLHK